MSVLKDCIFNVFYLTLLLVASLLSGLQLCLLIPDSYISQLSAAYTSGLVLSVPCLTFSQAAPQNYHVPNRTLLSHPNNPLDSPSLCTTVTLPALRLGSRPSGSYPTSSILPLACSPWTCLSTGGFLKQTFGHAISLFKIFHWLFK